MHDIRTDRRAFLGTLAALGMAEQVFQRPSRAADPKRDPLGLARKVETLYASCRTYRDKGQVDSIFRMVPEPKQAMAARKPRKITTAFVRPDKFRFEFDDERAGKLIRNLIWMDGRTLKTWWDLEPRVKTPESLLFALGGSAGVTESSSVTIPALLMPVLLKRRPVLSEGPGELSLLEDEPIGTHACRRLRRRSEALNFRTRKKFEVVDTYWIDAKTSAIRRVVKEMQIDEGSRSIGTLDLEPEFDVTLSDAELAFDPPKPTP